MYTKKKISFVSASNVGTQFFSKQTVLVFHQIINTPKHLTPPEELTLPEIGCLKHLYFDSFLFRNSERNNGLRQAPFCEFSDRSQRPSILMVSKTVSVRFENILKKK